SSLAVFFFQAEDGIRDLYVTGVQTCALPISPAPDAVPSIRARGFNIATSRSAHVWPWQPSLLPDSPWQDKRVRQAANLCVDRNRSEERRVGKECCSRWGRCQ